MLILVTIIPCIVDRIPREKPAPKPKPLSKWEEYAKAKGISKNKKGKKVWDTELKVRRNPKGHGTLN